MYAVINYGRTTAVLISRGYECDIAHMNFIYLFICMKVTNMGLFYYTIPSKISLKNNALGLHCEMNKTE